MISTVRQSDREEKVSSFGRKKSKMMQSVFVISMVLGFLFCFPSSIDAVECSCSDLETDNQFGQVLGACATRAPFGPHKGKYFCYVPNANPECCQDSSAKFTNHCVNFDLCDCTKVDCTVFHSPYARVY